MKNLLFGLGIVYFFISCIVLLNGTVSAGWKNKEDLNPSLGKYIFFSYYIGYYLATPFKEIK